MINAIDTVVRNIERTRDKSEIPPIILSLHIAYSGQLSPYARNILYGPNEVDISAEAVKTLEADPQKVNLTHSCGVVSYDNRGNRVWKQMREPDEEAHRIHYTF
jgi:hypothetical protein